ncbi:MAG: zinc ABC transporter substrate-binding protein [Candidatus Eisenbacteria bacterium]
MISPRSALRLLIPFLVACISTGKAQATPLKIGVTLHPYYSWTANVVAGVPEVEVRGVIPAEVDAGDYQPTPKEIAQLADLDAIVINGLGHDDFILDMLRASGNDKVVIIRPNDATPQIRGAHGEAANSHTFISFTNAIQQTYAIARELGKLRPADEVTFEANAAAYAKRLRAIKAEAATKLADPKISRVVTVHDGYSYLLQEFGIELAGVIEPAHGLIPSAKEMEEMVELVRREKVRVVLSEASFPDKLLQVLRDEAGVKVYIISHIATGAYSPDEFEAQMKTNADTLVEALVTDPSR